MAITQRRRAVDPLWFKDAVIYETHVKAFFDSNGDGVGDLRGLVEKLDYLQELGISCLWLLPFFPSPLPAVLVPVVLFISFAGGWLMAGIVLRPINTIATLANGQRAVS